LAPAGGLPGWVWVVLAAAVLAGLAGALLWRRSPAARREPEAPAPPLQVRIDRPAGEDGVVWTLSAGGEVVSGSAGELSHEPYERQRAALPDELRRALTGRRAPSGAPLAVREVELLVSQELAAMPWEAPLLLAASDLRIACWRAAGLATASPGAASSWPPPDAARAMLAPATWAQLVEERLGPIRLLDESVSPEGAPEPGGLLLIMGSPVQTTAGSRLLVEDSGTRSSSSRTLVEPDALPYDRFGLVVVLCEPSESLVRVDAEREQASDLRSCAAELLTAGAAAVLCLPAMPAELAGGALGTLDQRLRQKGERGRRQLAAAAAAIRAEIAAAGASPEERAGVTELALEVTVFVRP
jgi:hypothetical protein